MTSSESLSDFEVQGRLVRQKRNQAEGLSPELAKELRMRFWSHLKNLQQFEKVLQLCIARTRANLPVEADHSPPTILVAQDHGWRLTGLPAQAGIEYRNVVPSPRYKLLGGLGG